jgi:hypothetical protein
MQSPNFYSQVIINPGATYGGNTWDQPTAYRNFYAMISSNTKCLITVFQDSDPSQSSSNAIKTFSYVPNSSTQVFSGEITNRFISFSIKNLDNMSSTTNFYVVYK